jgi:GTPase Era involved in 16S rRNA processing
MEKDIIKLQYHSVLKEFYLYRKVATDDYRKWENDTSMEQSLRPYLEKGNNGEFLLQDQKEQQFFDAILMEVKASNIDLEFEGTEIDYGDLINMINYYNKNNGKKNINLLPHEKTLPSVNKIYSDLIALSAETQNDLEKEINNYSSETFGKIYKKELERLKVAIEEINKNPVAICFIGGYSTGKSTLINALLGVPLLPKAIEAKTTAIFRIINDKNISIQFSTIGREEKYGLKVNWENNKPSFSFNFKHELTIFKEIKQILRENQDEPCVEKQIYNLLDYINNHYIIRNEENIVSEVDEYVTDIVDIYYPINFTNSTNFTIYDTPGTDSNRYQEFHEVVLKKAINDPKNSILVCVFDSVKLEGTPNQMLFSLLDKVTHEKAEGGVSIDKDRSFHVINRIDGCDYDQIPKLPKKSIEYAFKDGKKSLPLSDKKLFFTSARAGLAAKARIKGIKGVNEREYEQDKKKILEDKYYQFNKMSYSDYATDMIIRESDDFFNKEKSEEERVYIASGIYSLKKAISNYTEKYALSTKTNNYYQAVTKLIKSIDYATSFYKTKTAEKLDEQEIEEEMTRKALVNDLEKCTKEFIYEEKMNENKSEYIIFNENEISEIRKKVEKLGFSWFYVNEQKIDSRQKENIKLIRGYIQNLSKSYSNNRENLIKTAITQLIGKFNQCIENCNLSQLEKEFILDFGSSLNIPDYVHVERFKLPKKKWWFFHWVDKKSYKEEIVTVCSNALNRTIGDCEDDYERLVENNGNKLFKDCSVNIFEISNNLKKMKENKEKSQKELEEAAIFLSFIKEKIKLFKKTVWGGNND